MSNADEQLIIDALSVDQWARTADGALMGGDGPGVPRLNAASAYASKSAQDSMGYASGTCLGEASFFGRRAGRHAATIRE